MLYGYFWINITPSPILGSSGGNELVLNLTFNNKTDPWKDYSDYLHDFTLNGNTNWVNTTFGKWYGAINFSRTAGDIINATSNFSINNGFSSFILVILSDNTKQ